MSETDDSESSHSIDDGKDVGDNDVDSLDNDTNGDKSLLNHVDANSDDTNHKDITAPSLTPKIEEPTTPSNNDSLGGTPLHQSSQTPGSTPGTSNTPIHPYMPYYPAMMSGFPAAPSTDPLLTGATANPYQYTDVSNLNDPVPDTRRNRGGVTEPFPEKLHRMLEQTERDGLSDIVSFFSHGRAFAIHKPKRFQAEIMPIYFKQTRLTSFQRQLNLYGFRRISQGPDNGGYYHELFLKGRPGLCVNMKRTKVKGSLKLKRDPDTEPNFYSYPPIKPVAAPMMSAPPHPNLPPMSHGQQSPMSPMPFAYPGYNYSSAPFPGYPGNSSQQPGPYTAAQQPMQSQHAPNMYGYPMYYQYPAWYPMSTTMNMPLSSSTGSPVQEIKSDDSTKHAETPGTNDTDHATTTTLAI